jgi:hypothetical protein
MKKLSLEEISRLNILLDDSLNQASKKELASCIKLLGTSLAHLKIKHKVDEDKVAKNFLGFVQELENESLSDEFNELATKTIIECATVMSVIKEADTEK